jgi:hypothetical protein
VDRPRRPPHPSFPQLIAAHPYASGAIATLLSWALAALGGV